MAEEDFGLPWYWWAAFGVIILLVIGKLNRSSACHPVNTIPAKLPTQPALGASTGGDCLKNGCAVVSGVCEKVSCYVGCLGCWQPTECGKLVKLGYKYFSSTLGDTILPGTAGKYFTAEQLNTSGANPWGLTTSSQISNGQYSQIKAFFAGTLKNTPAGYYCQSIFNADNAKPICMLHICVGPAPLQIQKTNALTCAPNRPTAPGGIARVL